MTDLLYEFAEHPSILNLDEIYAILDVSNIEKKYHSDTINFLLESNFLGYGIDNNNYRYPVSIEETNIMQRRATRHAKQENKTQTFKIHKAFHESLLINN